MTHIILHNPHAAKGNGMEIYSVSEVKKLLDRVAEIFDGSEFNGISKEKAGMMLDGRFDDLCPRRDGHALREFSLASKGGRCAYLYYATMGKAE